MIVKEQLLWEQECVRRGEQRYYDQQDKAREQGKDLTDASSFILKDRLRSIAATLKADIHRKQAGKGAQYNKLVRQLAGDEEDYLKIGYIGIKYLLAKLGEGKKLSVTKYVSNLGGKLEAEMKCKLFEAKYPDYFYTVMQSFDEQGVTSGVHIQKALMKKFNDFDVGWNDWTVNARVQVGVRVLRSILKNMDDLVFTQKTMSRGKTDFYLDTTVGFDEWVAEFEKERGLLLPMYLPLKCPPVPWDKEEHGGYYTPRMAIPFIKVRGRDAREFVRQANPLQHKRAVNKLQRTPWKINNKVLEVQAEVFQRNLGIGVPQKESGDMTPFPPHLALVAKEDLRECDKEEITAWKMLRKSQYEKERKRKGQVIGFRQGHLLAQELKAWDEMYFVYNCDFRGRIYCATTGLSPQGADHAKGLLHFAKGVRLGRDGIKWLAIHGANTYGEDKLSYEDRVKWVQDNEPLIRAIVEDPITHRQWGDADKPYQFLAFCFEWAECDYGRNPNAEGHLPVGLDGSCNGLQHFSAMLRDEVGAKATNLIDSDLPEDIYQEVADVTTRKLQERKDDEAFAKIWLQVGITRKCAKRPVMTLPYGATQVSARQYILEYAIDNWAKFNIDDKHRWELAKYLTPILWEAIGEVVVAAREAMAWLQRSVGTGYCSWTTVVGFPIYQHYRKDNMVVVNTTLEGRVQLHTPDMDKGIPYKSGQKNGIAPNFVHSIDSTHMVLTINSSNLHSYAMIHDDFGTHAGNTQHMFDTIRRSFKYMYSKTDPLKHWASQVGADANELYRGSYNLEDITDAKYFFG